MTVLLFFYLELFFIQKIQTSIDKSTQTRKYSPEQNSEISYIWFTMEKLLILSLTEVYNEVSTVYIHGNCPFDIVTTTN